MSFKSLWLLVPTFAGRLVLLTGFLVYGLVVDRFSGSVFADGLTDIGVVEEPKLVHKDFQFTEGPAADRQGNLFFTDIPAETIFKLTAQDELSVAIKPSGHANGLMFDAAGKLIACQMDGQVVAYDLAKPDAKTIAGTFNGKRFNAPNDLTIDEVGGVYFTDPGFRAPNPLPQGTMNVYYRDTAGTVHLVAADLKAPNGVGLAPDGKTLYVIPSMSAEMLAYGIESPGKVGESRVFCTLRQAETQPASRPEGGDGMTVDDQGNLYITSGTGVQVFSPSGEFLGTIKVPERPANVAFGGPMGKTLYITARTGLYRLELRVSGLTVKGTVPLPE